MLLLQAGVAAAATPVTFHASFGGGARLGRSTSAEVRVLVSPLLGPVTSLRLLTPPGIDLLSGQLGASSCRRPISEITSVMSPAANDPCPTNSLLATGRADAALLVDPPAVGAATLRVHAGAPINDKLGLLVIADTFHPARFHLTYQGYVYLAPGDFGIGVAIEVPQIPALPFGAPIALTRLRLSLGARNIVYTRRRRGRVQRYHPRGVVLPRRCPRNGFRFRLILRFADGTRRSVDDVAACPPHQRR